jgi:hypothetical protein
VERVLPNATVKTRMSALAVGLAVDWYTADAAIVELCDKNLPDPKAAPMVAFLSADGAWVDGYSGWIEPVDFLKVVARAEASPLLHAKPEVRKALEKPAASATAAAAKADWKTVLTAAREAKKSMGRCPERTAIANAEKQARNWAAGELDAIAQAAATGGDLAALRKRLTAVKAPFAGEPEAADVDTGLKALQRLAFVREVEAGGNPARDLRPRSAEPFQGTRWTAVFDKPTTPPPGK